MPRFLDMIPSARFTAIALILAGGAGAQPREVHDGTFVDLTPRSGSPPVSAADGWSPPINLTPEGGFAYLNQPGGYCLAVDSQDDAHLVFASSHGGTYRIYYRRFDSGTESWDPIEQISTFGDFGVERHASLAVDAADRVHVVWAHDAGNQLFIYYRVRLPLGWSVIREIGSFTGYTFAAGLPTIQAPGDVIHVAWTRSLANPDGSIVWYRKWDGVWQPTETIVEIRERYAIPALAASEDGEVWVAWTSPVPPVAIYGDIQYRRLDPATGEWGETRSLGLQTGRAPSLLLDPPGNLHLTWTDARLATTDVYYRRLSAHTEQWSAELNLSALPSRSPGGGTAPSSSANSAAAKMSVDRDGLIHVFWHDHRYDVDLIFGRRQIAGGGWSEVEVPWPGTSSQHFPAATVDSANRLHLVWEEGLGDVFYSSKEQGATGVEPSVRPTSDRLTVAPNPFRSVARIHVRGTARGPASMTLHDVRGRLVRRLLEGDIHDRRTLAWDGRDELGRPQPAGIYFLRLETAGAYDTKKITRLR